MDDTPPASPNTARPFPTETWRQLGRVDLHLIDTIAFLSECTARQSPKRAHYCRPSRKWLARRLGCSLRTISRHTARLAGLGVLSKLQRRPLNGRWQTNLYALNGAAHWQLAAFVHRLRRTTHRLSSLARLGLSRRPETPDQSPKEALSSVIARGMAKFAPG